MERSKLGSRRATDAAVSARTNIGIEGNEPTGRAVGEHTLCKLVAMLPG